MSSKAKSFPVLQPLDAIHFLAVRTCGLPAHFICKGLGPGNGQNGFELAAQAVH
jgi:hypothetical protein